MQRFTRSNDFILRTVGGECLLVPLGARVAAVNGVIVLNGTARCVWEHLGEAPAEARSLDDLAAAVADQFTVDLARAREDVLALLEALGRLGAVQS